METYLLKRFARASQGEAETYSDTIRLSAADPGAAEKYVTRLFASLSPPIDWEKDFARLETEEGAMVAEWSSDTLRV